MKAFSELTSASQVNNDDLVAISQDSGNGYASKKTTVKDITDISNLNLAEEYDSTSTYAVDDYVIYESALYKCIGTTTGAFDSTKWTSVVVTDEMGSGGGGTGGHTIIDENGTSMTARSGLQFVGGANVTDDSTNNKTIVDLASAGGIDGVFFDKDNVVQTQTSVSIVNGSSASYTATEDCILMDIYLSGIASGKNIIIKIDNVSVFYEAVNNNNYSKTIGYFPLKKGQTIEFSTNNTSSISISYTVYGIQTGTTHSKFQPVIYSLEEREIGVWKDGKPLYQKTLVVANVGSVGPSLTTPIEINDIPFDFITVVDANIYDSSDNRRYILSNLSKTTNDRIFFHPYLNKAVSPVVFYGSLYSGGGTYSNMTDLNVTIQYTKSTDTAGSGIWTPSGIPAVHYSTEEHIVGTWIDGSTLYEKTYVANSERIASNSSNPASKNSVSLIFDFL